MSVDRGRRRHPWMARGVRVLVLFLSVLAMSRLEAGAEVQPDGRLTIAFDASIAPSFLDPAETTGLATPFVFSTRRMTRSRSPARNNMAPCLAESWKESPDGLVYEFQAAGSSFTTAIRSRPRT